MTQHVDTFLSPRRFVVRLHAETRPYVFGHFNRFGFGEAVGEVDVAVLEEVLLLGLRECVGLL